MASIFLAVCVITKILIVHKSTRRTKTMTWKCSTTSLKSVKELYFISKEKTETYRGKGSGKRRNLKAAQDIHKK